MRDTEPVELKPQDADWLPSGGTGRSGADLADADSLRRQVRTLTAQLELLQDCVAQILKSRSTDERAPSDYDWLVRRFQHWLAERLPATARVLVVSRGDGALLAIPDRQAGHFPQDDTGQYAGFHPADDAAAIGHLEALRHDGYDTLVFPEPAAWWLDHYQGLRQHLDTHYFESVSGPLGTVFDLRRRAARRGFDDLRLEHVMAQVRRSLGRDPDVLDWTSGAELRRRFPALAVAEFSGPGLPHCDRSLDIVAIPDDGAAALREARRVATCAVVVMRPGRALRTQWLIDPAAAAAPGQVTIMHVPDPLETGRIRTSRLTVDDGPAEDVLVWTSAGVVALPGAVAALVATLRRFPDAGVVGGRILDFAGRLLHAGGAMGVDAILRSRGEGVWNPDDPRYACVQAVDYCSSLFMATTRRAFDAAGGFDPDLACGAWRDADFCLRVQERGYGVYYQPESVAVCSARLTRALRAAADPASLRRERRPFATRWKTVLQSRVPRGDVWGI